MKKLRSDVPPELERLVLRSPEKDRQARYAFAGEMGKDLERFRSRLATPELRALLRRPRFAVPALALLLAMLALGAWFGINSFRVHWARNVALPEIARLVEKEHFNAALRIARQAERYLPDEPQLQHLRQNLLLPVSFRTTPSGADVYLRDFMDTEDPAGWEFLGRTPLENIRIPPGYLRCKITKQGHSLLVARGTEVRDTFSLNILEELVSLG